MTEAYDYLRILFAKEGIAYCPETGEEIRPIHIDFVYKKLLDEMNHQKVIILAPIKIQTSFDFAHFKKEIQRLGFIRIKLNDEYFEIDDEIPFSPKKKNILKVVIDRIVIKSLEKKIYI
jgi:excinuclease ABC subunit A